jgi:hypothetical protein
MVPQHCGEIYIGQDITIQHKKGSVEKGPQRSQGSGRTQKDLFIGILELHPYAISITVMVGDDLGTVIQVDGDLGNLVCAAQLQQIVEDRPITYREHRFRAGCCERPKAASLTST